MEDAKNSSFEEFCGGTFWDTTLTWTTTRPDLTSCFQETVLVWVPPAWLLGVLPLYISYLRRTTDPPTPRGRLHVAKIIVCCALVLNTLVQTALGGVDLKRDRSTPLVRIVSPAISTTAFIASAVLTHVERKCGLVTSGVQFIFWLLAVISGIPTFYSKVMNAVDKGHVDDMPGFVMFFVAFLCYLVEFTLFSFAEWKPRQEYTGKPPCPEAYASFLSRITYWWLNGTVLAGYKRPLEESDMWGLNTRDMSINAAPVLEAAWNRELLRCKWNPRGAVDSQPLHLTSPLFDQQDDDDDGSAALLSSCSPDFASSYIHQTAVPGGSPKSQKTPSLFRVLVSVYGITLLQAHLCKLVCDVLTFVGPVLQRLLITFTEDRSSHRQVWVWHGFLFAALFFVVSAVKSFFFQQLYHIGITLGMRVKSAVIALIYQKALTLSNDAKKQTTVGEIVNLMSVDAQRLQDVTGYLWMVWSSPFQIAVAVWLLWGLVGPSVFAGLAVMIILIPVNVIVAAKQRKLQVAQMAHKDNRIKLMNEVLSGIKVLKLYAWELAFRHKVASFRELELEKLQSYSTLAAVGSFSWTLATFLVTLATFTTYVLTGHVLDAETAFVALSLFNILYFPINLLPIMISYIVTASVSISRLNKFLCQEDIDFNTVGQDTDARHPIVMTGATLSWSNRPNNPPVLTNIDLTVQKGSLIAVVGQVGAGKSSLISAILGEMDKHHGLINVNGRVAYVAQQAWIQNATLRDNILFGKPYEDNKYDAVLEACALKPDLEILPGGDQTEIGEKGINLSGGQKQRVSLARAIYNDADIYLLDDPLSAVDAHVGKHIFERVICETGLLKHKTRVLVTNGLHWLPRVDQVVVLVKGVVSEVGTYGELLQHDGPFAKYLKTYLLHEDQEGEDTDPEVVAFRRQMLERLESVADTSGPSETDTVSNSSGEVDASPDAGAGAGADAGVGAGAGAGAGAAPRRKGKKKRKSIKRAISRFDETGDTSVKQKVDREVEKLIVEERAEVGKVKWSVFFTYARALGLINTAVLLGSYVFYQAASVGANIWLTDWANDNTSYNSSDYPRTRDLYLGVYGAFGIGQAFFILIYALVSAYANVRASRELHAKVLLNVLKAPMSFFDTTPSGRILNRFSRDVETVDSILPQLIRNWLNTFFIVFSSIVVIGYSTPAFLAVVVPIGLLYYFIQKFYIPTSRQLKRLESTTRSPVYAHFSETINGASTIRAYQQEDRFISKSFSLVDSNLIFYFSSVASNRWLGFRLDFVSACIVLAAAVFAVGFSETLSAAIVGLSISYALQATTELNWMVRVTSDLESNIVSVERLKEYTETPTEADWTNEATSPQADWPQTGCIVFNQYSTRYRAELDLVLDGLSFKVKAGEKVGIVGRTGAGKSSLTLALFRIIEATGGEISIDDVHIAQLGLHQLRSKLTILPQDPVLFSGTLRMNIDPLSEYEDIELWKALDRAYMGDYVSSLPETLSYECGEGGKNLSVGQRQLMCLARALLHKTAVLILDEATAAVDLQTDDLIQQTIRAEFSDCTILTIAHRLNTVMDSDRILVLDKGRVAEYDTPTNLLRDETTIFFGMAHEAGLV